jgi:hypothetical protein
MKQHRQAKEWRLARGLSIANLAELSGYSVEALYIFERGQNPDGSKIADWVWQRYKMCCAGIDAQIRSGIDFKWGE